MRISLERRRTLRVLGACGLGGCSVVSTLNRPSDPLPNAVPTAVFEVTADSRLNPDREGVPKPVLLRIYELRGATAFDRASFLDLQDKEDGQLGIDFVRREDFLIVPGQDRIVERKGNTEVRAFGLVAGFRNLERSTWRTTVAAPNSVELRRLWWGLGPTELLPPVRYLVRLGRDTVTVRISAVEK